MSTFPSLNLEKLRNDTIKKLEKEEYFDRDLLEKEFQDFLQHQQLYTSKQIIEDHIKDKSVQKDLVPFILRKEMKYLDEILTNRDKIRDR